MTTLQLNNFCKFAEERDYSLTPNRNAYESDSYFANLAGLGIGSAIGGLGGGISTLFGSDSTWGAKIDRALKRMLLGSLIGGGIGLGGSYLARKIIEPEILQVIDAQDKAYARAKPFMDAKEYINNLVDTVKNKINK